MITKDDKGKLRVLEVVFSNNDDVLGVLYKNNFYPVGKPRKSEEPIEAICDAYGKLIWIIENGIVYTTSKCGYVGGKENWEKRQREKFQKEFREWASTGDIIEWQGMLWKKGE